jgi:hypothetical protein
MTPRASSSSCDAGHVGGYAASRSAAASVQCRLSVMGFVLLLFATTRVADPLWALICTNVSLQRANQLQSESSGE